MPRPLSPEQIDAERETEALWKARARAVRDVAAHKGSMAWATAKGRHYLARSFYDPDTGRRRQVSLGLRSPQTEAIMAAFEVDRVEADARLAELDAALDDRRALHRALGLARLPLPAAKVLRGLDRLGFFDAGLRVVGAAALFAYEAGSGRRLGAGEFDPLAQIRQGLRLMSATPLPPRRLIDALARIDHGFRADGPTSAVDADGFRVEWIAPPEPPARTVAHRTPRRAPRPSGTVELELQPWYAGATTREAMVIDARGAVLRLATIDPRVFAAADLWRAGDLFRDPAERARDRIRAEAVAALLAAGGPISPPPLRVPLRAAAEELVRRVAALTASS